MTHPCHDTTTYGKVDGFNICSVHLFLRPVVGQPMAHSAVVFRLPTMTLYDVCITGMGKKKLLKLPNGQLSSTFEKGPGLKTSESQR